MNDSFAYDTFNSSEDPMEDLFPPLNQEGGVSFDAIAISNDTTTEQLQHPEIDSHDDESLSLNHNNQDSSSTDLLWRDVDNLSIPDFQQNNKEGASSCSSTTAATQCDNDTTRGLMIPNSNDSTGVSTGNGNNTMAGAVTTTTASQDESSSLLTQQQQQDCASAVFNISWGGSEDKPPAELHLENSQESEMVSRRPLPKPRGVKRLPEPEPAEDGTLDEDTLRRRRNTYAARRSRLKKFLKIEYLENRVNQLQTENAKLVLNNALLESEKRGWVAKEAEYKKRIKLLESSSGQSSASSTPSTDTQEPMEQ
ncbi:hypothetical protein BDA99DRAFT_492421 [Phascolomyces articulosus]|uniref:BZIP domain-containing protein n=1 Tax=Phascolomyces articulosus TaxID=60185 RepID=A0AAD5KCN1_9FUNG|nr:hypothetical protein BDA99DRAFT_492421 [Phascolomyces articulosus]